MGVGSWVLFLVYIVCLVVVEQGICTLEGSKCKKGVMRVECCPMFQY